jgi:hypothetical protein
LAIGESLQRTTKTQRMDLDHERCRQHSVNPLMDAMDAIDLFHL